MRLDDRIIVKKIGTSSFLAVHIRLNDRRPQDDCTTFLLKCGDIDRPDSEMAAIAARRLIAGDETYHLQINNESMYWDGIWRVFPLKREILGTDDE